MVKTVKDCLAILNIECEDLSEVNGITCDSRKCKAGDIFVAIQGLHHHGSEFIGDAKRKGALCLGESSRADYFIREPKKVLNQLVDYFYDDLCASFCVIGVSGTNGKTSLTQCLRQCLVADHQKVMRIGSETIEYLDQVIENDHTTPSYMDCLNLFLLAKEMQINVLLMEVSSHALSENRVGFVHFDYFIYTNITSDHLDFHQTFTHYQYSKFKARFQMKEKGIVLLNYDCLALHEFFRLQRISVITYGHKGMHVLSDCACSLEGSDFKVDGVDYRTSLLGLNNIYNAFLCVLLLRELDYNDAFIHETIAQLKTIEGRMEMLIRKQRYFLIDYAHTEDALEKVLLFLNQNKVHRLISVIGCGGERDKSKRFMMGYLAATMSDIALFTEDNSRHEKIEDILKDMAYSNYSNVIVEKSRKQAIQLALSLSEKHDIILLAGKGNEQFMFTGDAKIPYNDKAFIIEETKGDV